MAVTIGLLGNPENRRVSMFVEAARRLGLPEPELFAYEDWFAGAFTLGEVLGPEMILRIESPGENAGVIREITALGAEADPELATLPADQARTITPRHGQIWHPGQRARGWAAALERMEVELSEADHLGVMSAPGEIAAMFDKRQTQARFEAAGVRCPERVEASSYEELTTYMDEVGLERVFVKLHASSSASGVVAYRREPGREVAISSAKLDTRADALRLFNSLRIQRYTDPDRIALLLDWIFEQGAVVERWIPKTSMRGEVFDLRVVAIDGQARHAVVRQSRTPMTNLHLGNRRGDFDAFLELVGDEAWERGRAEVARALGAFPGELYAGVDLMFEEETHAPTVIEINAFGDLVPNLTHQGQDTYEAEIEALMARAERGTP